MKLNLFWRICGWSAISCLLIPVLHTFWISFSPDSFLTPPTDVWSGRWYTTFANDRRWRQAAWRSMEVATVASLISVVTGWMIANVVQAGSRLGRTLTFGVLLPALIPSAALGMGMLPMMHLLSLWMTLWAIILAHATLGLPIAFLIFRSYWSARLSELQEVARGLGASELQIMFRITLPLSRPPIIASYLSVFVLSLNESLITQFLATPHNETLPSVIWPQLRYSPSPLVAVASCLTTATGIVALVFLHKCRPSYTA